MTHEQIMRAAANPVEHLRAAAAAHRSAKWVGLMGSSRSEALAVWLDRAAMDAWAWGIAPEETEDDDDALNPHLRLALAYATVLLAGEDTARAFMPHGLCDSWLEHQQTGGGRLLMRCQLPEGHEDAHQVPTDTGAMKWSAAA